MVLVKKGAMVRSQGMMYNEVSQLVLLYVSETWVVTGGILKVLEGSHHQEARRITGMKATGGPGGE